MSARKAFVPSRPQSACFTDAEVTSARAGATSDSDLPHAASMTFGRPRSSVDNRGFGFGNRRGTAGGASTPAPNGGGKPLSLSGLLKKRTQIQHPNVHTSTQSDTDAAPHAKKPRRSFEGILRPEMTPISIVPYPAGVAPMDGLDDDATPRKQLSFSRSMSRTLAGGMDRDEDKSPQGELDGVGEQRGNEESNGNLLTDRLHWEIPIIDCMHTDVGAIPVGYMRMLPGADMGVLRATGGGNTAPSPSMIVAPVPGYAHFDPGITEITVHAKGDVNDVHEQMHPTRGTERLHGNTNGKIVDAEIALQGRNAPGLAHGPRRVRVDQESQDPDQQGSGQRPQKRARQETNEVRILVGNVIRPSGNSRIHIVTMLTP